MPERTLCVWCPDWPVTAARAAARAPAEAPVVVIERGLVHAASAEARAETVTIGLRRREAEARCPGLVVVDVDHAGEARVFEPVARAVEAITPRLVLDRPGVLAFPTRGPSRYHGGDHGLAARVHGAIGAAMPVGEHVPAARVGVADSTFAARLAARRATVVEPGRTPAFLAPWPVAVLGDPRLAELLGRLGLRTLGAFAALPPSAVLARFGRDGLAAHRLACGDDPCPAALSVPPPELVETVELDPPADRVDAAAFAAKMLADRLLDRLADHGLACSQVLVEAETEHGEHLARRWRHEGALTAAALAERVRWQLEGWLTASGGLSGGLTLLRLTPDEVMPAHGRQLGFWGGDAAASDRAARVLARVQGMLGPDAVVSAVRQGGRTPAERVRWVPWGEPREVDPRRPADPVAGPVAVERPSWPGAVPGPAPARVLDPPVPATLLDAAGRAVVVTARGETSAVPAVLHCPVLPDGGGAVTGWAGPWAHDVRWWDRAARRRAASWQVTVGDTACLVRVTRTGAALEALYD